MNELFKNISKLTVSEVMIVGIVLFLGLRIIQKGINVYTTKKQGNSVFKRFFPIIEFAAWIIFVIWAAKLTLQPGIAAATALILSMGAIFAWAGRFLFRDWVAGVVFKTENRYNLDDIVRIRNTSGRLTNLGYRSLTIETTEGITVEIPYSMLVGENTLEKFPRETAWAKFQLSVPMGADFSEIQQKIRLIALCAPWISVNSKPAIRLLEERENQYIIEVIVHIIDQTYKPEVDAYLKKNVIN